MGLPDTVPVVYIPPAVPSQLFQRRSPISPLELPLRILTVARLHWVKGLEHTLEALARLNDQGVEFHYTLVGEGMEYERLVFAAYQLGISGQVSFKGKVPHEEIAQELEKADLYVQYSLQEGFCNAVLEAQAMGLLCIVSDAGGLPENVLDGKTGWVVPRRQPASLAAKIMDVLSLPEEERLRIRKQAMERVRKEFSLEDQQAKWKQFFYEEA